MADGTVSYVTYSEPYFDLKKESLKAENCAQVDLNVLGEIGLDGIVRAIKEIVPEAVDEEDGELLGDYELSFLDFCDILVNLSTIYLENAENYYKYLKAEEEEALARENALKEQQLAAVSSNMTPSSSFSQKKGTGKKSRRSVRSPTSASLKSRASSIEKPRAPSQEAPSEIDPLGAWRPKKFEVQDPETESL